MSVTVRWPQLVSTGFHSLLGSSGATFALVIFSVDGHSSWLLVTTAGVLTLYSTMGIWSEYRRGRLFSPLAILSGLFLVHFGVPGILAGAGLLPFQYSSNLLFAVPATAMVLLALSAFELGSILARGWGATAARTLSGPALLSKRGLFVALVLALIGWLARVIIVMKGAYFQIVRGDPDVLPLGVASWIRLVEHLPLWGMLLVLLARGRSTRVAKVWPWLAVSEFAYWAVAGRKEEAVLVVALSTVVIWFERRALPSARTLLLGLAAVTALFPASYLYRQSMASVIRQGLSPTSVVALSVKHSPRVFAGIGQSNQAALQRLNLTESVSASIRLVEGGVWPTRYGQDYANALIILVPRVLWKGKPNYHYGNDFGVAAGFLRPTDRLTSISVTYLGEAYLNFGPFGWLIYLVVGAVGTLIFEWAWRSRREDALLMYLIALTPFLYIGGTAAMYFGGFVKVLLVFGLLSPILFSYSTRRGTLFSASRNAAVRGKKQLYVD